MLSDVEHKSDVLKMSASVRNANTASIVMGVVDRTPRDTPGCVSVPSRIE